MSLAVLFAVFGPAMDAIAKEDAREGYPTVMERVLASFDVLDDALDHLYGAPGIVQQQHLQTSIPPASAALVRHKPGVAKVAWPADAPLPLNDADRTPPDHPPRS